MDARPLFALMLTIAVLFAPAVTGAAMATAPRHDMQMKEAGHCQTPPSQGGNHGKADKNCCISMCIALAVAPSAPAEAAELGHAATYPRVSQSWHGFLGEIATPPPRIA